MRWENRQVRGPKAHRPSIGRGRGENLTKKWALCEIEWVKAQPAIAGGGFPELARWPHSAQGGDAPPPPPMGEGKMTHLDFMQSQNNCIVTFLKGPALATGTREAADLTYFVSGFVMAP